MSYTLWDDTPVILSTDNGGLPSSGGFNWPLRGTKYTVSAKEARGASFFIWKMVKIAATKRHEKQRICASDGLVSNVN